MEQDWAKEPLRWDEKETAIVDKDGKLVALADYFHFKDVALRLIATYNACAGVPMDVLEKAPEVLKTILMKAFTGAYDELKAKPLCPHCGKDWRGDPDAD